MSYGTPLEATKSLHKTLDFCINSQTASSTLFTTYTISDMSRDHLIFEKQQWWLPLLKHWQTHNFLIDLKLILLRINKWLTAIINISLSYKRTFWPEEWRVICICWCSETSSHWSTSAIVKLWYCEGAYLPVARILMKFFLCNLCCHFTGKLPKDSTWKTRF